MEWWTLWGQGWTSLGHEWIFIVNGKHYEVIVNIAWDETLSSCSVEHYEQLRNNRTWLDNGELNAVMWISLM